MAGHIFVSYSHKDGDYVTRMVAYLRASGLEVWTDEGLDYGSQWPGVIEAKIESCLAFVPVMSVSSREAPWVDREIDLAQELGKPILPLLLSGRRFLRLRNIQDEDVTAGDMPGLRFVHRLRTLTDAAPDARTEATTPPVRTHPDDPVVRGFSEGADLVRRTLGPLGRRVLVRQESGGYRESDDAVEIARLLQSQDTSETVGLGFLQGLVEGVRDEVGDGAATAVVLADAMLRGAAAELRAGAHPVALRRVLDAAVAAAAEHLARAAVEVEVKEQIEAVAALSAGDRDVGVVIAEAMDKVGKDGVITVEPGDTFGLELELVEGLRFDRGHVSGQFVTDSDRLEARLEVPYILITPRRLADAHELVPLLETLLRVGGDLLVIAEDVEGEALSMLIVNKIRGTFTSVAVRAPGFGDRRTAMLDDIAVLTGGEVVASAFDDLPLEALGRARRVITTQDETTIIDGAGDHDRIAARVDDIRADLQRTASDDEREKLMERLAKLAGGVAVIRVGAPTEGERTQRQRRVEHAVRAATAAVRTGLVPGGGAALARVAVHLRDQTTVPPDHAKGFGLLAESLSAPFRALVHNAGHDRDSTLAELLRRPATTAYDAVANEFVTALPHRLIDPVAVPLAALTAAAATTTRYLMIN